MDLLYTVAPLKHICVIMKQPVKTFMTVNRTDYVIPTCTSDHIDIDVDFISLVKPGVVVKNALQ